jgi:short-subunit dehydrogenase
MQLSGAVALVTGASSGIGQAVAQRLAAAGARVLAAGRDRTQLAELAEATGAIPLPSDLAEPGAGQDLAERALARHGRVDILVNNAGAGWEGRFCSMPEAEPASLIMVNLRAPIELTRALLPAMFRSGGGHLAYVTSIAGRLGVAREAVYAASKAGLDAFAQSLRMELAGNRVRVSVVVPGAVDTPFFARRGRPYDRRWPRALPPGRVADALVAAIARDRAEVYVPGWLRAPVGLRGLLPGLYRRLATRFG